MALYFDTSMYTDALTLGSALLRELKKLDDKNLLVEVSGKYLFCDNIIQVAAKLLYF